MKFIVGLLFSIVGLVLFIFGVLAPINTDPNLSASGQRRGTFFFFGLLLVLFGLLAIVADIFSQDDK